MKKQELKKQYQTNPDKYNVYYKYEDMKDWTLIETYDLIINLFKEDLKMMEIKLEKKDIR